MNKSILKVVGVVAVAAALCVGCGGDNGVSGGGNALYGTWCGDENCALSITYKRNGTYEYRLVDSDGVLISGSKGTYSTNGTTITMQSTEVYNPIGYGGWHNKNQFINAYIELYMSMGHTQENARIFAEDLAKVFGSSTQNYSVDGNTLTRGDSKLTKK